MAGSVKQKTAGYLPLIDMNNLVRPGPEAAIYLHFPFCRRRCSYCDFDSFSGLESLIGLYLEAVVEQIRHSPAAQGRSLYIGGGTPSLMAPSSAAALVRGCGNHFGLPADAEITLEANPSDLDRGKLEGYRDAGINRLSIGIQSTDGELLRLLGRRHGKEEAWRSVLAARDTGFGNVSVDLIFGLPHQNLDIWEGTLRDVAGWGVEHISCYSLTVEPGTALEKKIEKGLLSQPPEEEAVEMYRLAERVLAGLGYRKYEISNWSKPGFESQHNLSYWRLHPYLGIGAGAASFWSGRRYKISPDIRRYIKGAQAGQLPLCEDGRIDQHRAMSDFMILGLRLSEGISDAQFEARFETTPQAVFGEALDWGFREGLLERRGDRLALTPQGTLLSNELFEKLL